MTNIETILLKKVVEVSCEFDATSTIESPMERVTQKAILVGKIQLLNELLSEIK